MLTPKWVNPKSVSSQISTPIFPSTLSENTHPGLSYTLSRTALSSPALLSDDVMFYSLECKPCTGRCHCSYLPFHPLQFCCSLLAFLRIFRRTGADDYSTDHDDYNRRGDDDCRYRYALCSPASFICTKNKNLLSHTDRATRCVRQDLAYCCITL